MDAYFISCSHPLPLLWWEHYEPMSPGKPLVFDNFDINVTRCCFHFCMIQTMLKKKVGNQSKIGRLPVNGNFPTFWNEPFPQESIKTPCLMWGDIILGHCAKILKASTCQWLFYTLKDIHFSFRSTQPSPNFVQYRFTLMSKLSSTAGKPYHHQYVPSYGGMTSLYGAEFNVK